MARPRFQNLSETRRSELLEYAANEFALNGYDGASLNRIIQNTGLSKGSFYYYFDDKADLFETVAEFAIESVLGDAGLRLTDVEPEQILADLDRESFWPRLTELSVHATRRMHDKPWLVGLGKLFYSPPPAAQGLLEQQREEAHHWLRVLLEHGRKLGAVRDDQPIELLEQMVAGALEGSDRWFIERWNELEPQTREAHANSVIAAIRRMAETDS